MGYENAPATKMIAVYCAACSKELVDAVSVETGMGPFCRKKHAIPNTLDEDTRNEANKLVHFIACEQVDNEAVRDALKRLDELGCTVLVSRIAKRLYGAPIEVKLDGDRLVVKSGYNTAFIDRCRGIRSRQWVRELRATTFSPIDHKQVAEALCAAYGRARVVIGEAPAVPIAPDMFDDLCAGYVAPPTPPKPIKVTRDAKSGRVAIACPYDRDLVDAMKEVEGRAWDGDNRVNTFPAEREAEVISLINRTWDFIHVVEEDGAVPKPRARRARRNCQYKVA